MKPLKSNEATAEEVSDQLPGFMQGLSGARNAAAESAMAPPVEEEAVEEEEEVVETAPAAPAAPKPGTYTADGDPYTYKVDGDGSVTIMEGPTGSGQKLTKGAAYDAIVGQIRSGQLKGDSKPPMPGLSPDRPGMNAHLDDALKGAGGLRDATKRAVASNMGE
jgi:hypothetical protein